MIPRKYEGTGERYSPGIKREIARSRTWPTVGKDIAPLTGSMFYHHSVVQVRKYRIKIIEIIEEGNDFFWKEM